MKNTLRGIRITLLVSLLFSLLGLSRNDGLSSYASGSPQHNKPRGSLHTGGTVSFNSSTNEYVFDMAGSTEYVIKIDDGHLDNGMLRIRETSTGAIPMAYSGLVYTHTNGTVYQPFQLTSNLFTHFITSGRLVLGYSDTIGSVTIGKSYEITPMGKSLMIRAYAHAAPSNYYGSYTGFQFDRSESTPNAEPLAIPYMESAAQVTMFTGNSSSKAFYSLMVNWDESSATTIESMRQAYNPTSYRHYNNPVYERKTGNGVNQLDETIFLTVSTLIEDTFPVIDNVPSVYRSEMTGDAFIQLNNGAQAPAGTWNQFNTYLQQAKRLGMDNLNSYLFQWSKFGFNRNEPSYYPAYAGGGSDSEFASMLNTGKSNGYRMGLYTGFGLNDPGYTGESNPNYNATDNVRDAAGNPRPIFDTGLIYPDGHMTYALAPDKAYSHLNRELGSIQGGAAGYSAYDTNLAYLDVIGAYLPNLYFVDLNGNTQIDSIKKSMAHIRTNLEQARDLVNGPIFSEGSMGRWPKAGDTLFSGSADGYQRTLSTGNDLDIAGSPYYVIPDFELRQVKPLTINMGMGLISRFFNLTTGSLPLNRAMADELRATVISYGHNAYIESIGLPLIGNSTSYDYTTPAETVREYYMVTPLSAEYGSSNVETIMYNVSGTEYNLSSIYRNFTDWDVKLRSPRLHIAYDNGLHMYINHGSTDWAVTVGGVAYTIPQNGWVARNSLTGLLSFSAKPSGYSHRFDYMSSPNAVLLDGRGVSTTYGGRTSTYLSVSTTSGISITENASGALSVIP